MLVLSRIGNRAIGPTSRGSRNRAQSTLKPVKWMAVTSRPRFGGRCLSDVKAFEFKQKPPSGEFLKELQKHQIVIYDARNGLVSREMNQDIEGVQAGMGNVILVLPSRAGQAQRHRLRGPAAAVLEDIGLAIDRNPMRKRSAPERRGPGALRPSPGAPGRVPTPRGSAPGTDRARGPRMGTEGLLFVGRRMRRTSERAARLRYARARGGEYEIEGPVREGRSKSARKSTLR